MVTADLDLELSTMHDVAAALGDLDPAARARVLHWLHERFHDEAGPIQATAATAPAPVTTLRAVSPPVSASDELLSVETLNELFESDAPAAPAEAATAAPQPVAEAAPQPITGMLREFVAEFQDIAREWDGACDAPADARRPTRHLSAVS
jgi:hypothetical protein